MTMKSFPSAKRGKSRMLNRTLVKTTTVKKRPAKYTRVEKRKVVQLREQTWSNNLVKLLSASDLDLTLIACEQGIIEDRQGKVFEVRRWLAAVAYKRRQLSPCMEMR